MNMDNDILTDLRYVASPRAERERGLLGWVSGRLGEHLLIDGIAIRRGLDGRLHLSFPERRDARGISHSIVRPLNSATLERIEGEVFSALGMDQEFEEP